MTPLSKYLITVGSISSFVFLCLIIHRIAVNPYSEVTRYTIGDGNTLKVGIMGDSQLVYSENDPNKIFTEHLINAFNIFKEQKVQTIIFTGDIGNSGREYVFEQFKKIYDMTYQNETDKPILNIIMGNHDYWYFQYFFTIPSIRQYYFHKVFGEKPFSHKVINGYHFINWSTMDATTITCNTNLHWAKSQIELAVKEDPTKPIFINTHLAPYGTMYGSDEWGNRLYTLLFKDYPQIVSISGHSHFSLVDERSIWQGEFTAITTQSVAYIELERGKENGSVPRDEFNDEIYSRGNYMGIIMSVTEEKIELQRISFEKNEKYKYPWVIERPIDPSTFKYTDERYEHSKPPKFEGDFSIEYIKQVKDNKTYRQIKFTQAVHEDLVHSYRIVFSKKGKSYKYYYFSDFFLMKEDRGSTLTLKIPNSIGKGEYDVEIYAIESFGKESSPAKGKIIID